MPVQKNWTRKVIVAMCQKGLPRTIRTPAMETIMSSGDEEKFQT